MSVLSLFFSIFLCFFQYLMLTTSFLFCQMSLLSSTKLPTFSTHYNSQCPIKEGILHFCSQDFPDMYLGYPLPVLNLQLWWLSDWWLLATLLVCPSLPIVSCFSHWSHGAAGSPSRKMCQRTRGGRTSARQ